MAVESFIPITDVKNTTEKEVKRKPTIEELTTIERPGKPTPATFLDDSYDEEKAEKKAKNTKSKYKSTKKKVSKEETKEYIPRNVKRDSILIITEKPQAAMKIASALGKPYQHTESGVSYYELTRNNEKIIVASAVGHLFGLTYKKGQKGWPIFDLEWIPSYNNKAGAFTKRYFQLLKSLSFRAKEIIVATDFDIEGEVIGWNVLRFICKKETAKRMKFSTLTKDELEKAYDSPLKELAWGNAYAGESRHVLDWLYGINLSRALMSAIKTTGSFRILSIGRVQGPALKIIVDREKEIKNFVPVPYWQVFANLDWDSVKNPEIKSLSQEELKKIEFKHPKDIFEEKDLEKFKSIKDAEASTEKKEETISPPHPFDLTTLQREAYRLYKFSPSDTLKVAQKLYLDGLISYPRTSSQKIPKEIEPKKILKALEKYFPEAKEAKRAFPVEGKKSDPAHPSIFPTGEYSKLKTEEEKLYLLIVKRFIACFSDDAKTANKRVVLTSKVKDELITFTASGSKVLEKGWTRFYPMKLEETNLPDISGKVKINSIDFDKKETAPPNRYTPTSLISLLEKKNLGTKATRSSIVDTLFDRGYLDGTSIKATQLGMQLIEALEKYSPIIIDENLTRELEEQMEKIQDSTSEFKEKEDKIIETARRLITDISKEFKAQEPAIGKALLKGIEEIRKEQQENNTLMPCPECKKGNLRIMFNRVSRRYFIACSAYPECRKTFSCPPNSLIKKSGNQCEYDKFPKLLAIRKAKRPWEFCFNPDCKIELEKREKWKSRQGTKNASNEEGSEE